MSDLTSDTQALLAGAIGGMLMRYAADPDRSVLIDSVEGHDDGQGNHQPYFTVTMRSGAKLLVSVAHLPESDGPGRRRSGERTDR